MLCWVALGCAELCCLVLPCAGQARARTLYSLATAAVVAVAAVVAAGASGSASFTCRAADRRRGQIGAAGRHQMHQGVLPA